jgi:hypothetical protein
LTDLSSTDWSLSATPRRGAVYIYYQSYEAREQISKRSRQAPPKRMIQRISRRRSDRTRRRGNTVALDRGAAKPVGSLCFGA